MFPSLDFDSNIYQTDTETNQPLGKSFAFDFSEGDFIVKDGKLVKAEDVEAIKVWIQKMIMTERYKFAIYEDVDYGVTIKKLIMGKRYPTGFINSELKREITESMLRHPMITRIEDFATRQNGYTLTINFTVILKDGISFDQEVSI